MREGERDRLRGREKSERKNEATYLKNAARKMTMNSIGINRGTREEEKTTEENFESALVRGGEDRL